jgi:predicted nucleic acid-binding protein
VVSAGRLLARLDAAGTVALDTSPFIYHLEDVAPYSDLTEALFVWIARPRRQAVTSTLTLLEVLVGPYRARDEARVNEFYARLTTFPHLDWIPVSLEIADRAAGLRAAHGLRVRDAIQLATARAAGATLFLTNDRRLPSFDDVEVLMLDDFRTRTL